MLVNRIEAQRIEYPPTKENVEWVSEAYPLDNCSCRGEFACSPHYYIMTAIRQERLRWEEKLANMTIQDFLDLIKARDE